MRCYYYYLLRRILIRPTYFNLLKNNSCINIISIQLYFPHLVYCVFGKLFKVEKEYNKTNFTYWYKHTYYHLNNKLTEWHLTIYNYYWIKNPCLFCAIIIVSDGMQACINQKSSFKFHMKILTLKLPIIHSSVQPFNISTIYRRARTTK